VAVRACDLAEGWKQSRSLIMSSSKEARSMSRVKGCSDTAKVCVQRIVQEACRIVYASEYCCSFSYYCLKRLGGVIYTRTMSVLRQIAWVYYSSFHIYNFNAMYLYR
jgi:hypothetical protein